MSPPAGGVNNTMNSRIGDMNRSMSSINSMMGGGLSPPQQQQQQQQNNGLDKYGSLL
jgi:hypothetical protein